MSESCFKQLMLAADRVGDTVCQRRLGIARVYTFGTGVVAPHRRATAAASAGGVVEGAVGGHASRLCVSDWLGSLVE